MGEQSNLQELKDLQQAYIRTFASEHGQKVLADLTKKYSFQDKTTFSSLPYDMSYNEGQRTVFLYIQNLMKRDLKALEERDAS